MRRSAHGSFDDADFGGYADECLEADERLRVFD
jgi:hypothetical protein